MLCLAKCGKGLFSSSVFCVLCSVLAEAVRYQKFKGEFIINGRGCLVLLKFKSSLC